MGEITVKPAHKLRIKPMSILKCFSLALKDSVSFVFEFRKTWKRSSALWG